MTCPTLKDLPPPPKGKTGWPWTEENPQTSYVTPDGKSWPKISIVTPNYNYGQFIEETIRSVLLQGYPNPVYIIIDGGSTDNSVEIIRKYEPWLTYWVSESDRCPAHAINKGLEKSTGIIAAYLNSDDMYLPGCLQHAGLAYTKKRFDILVGRRKSARPKYFLLRASWWWVTKLKSFVYPFILEYNCRYEIPQESLFWNRSKYFKMRFTEKYYFCLDVWWFIQIFSGAKVVHTSRRLGIFRVHPQSKSFRLPTLPGIEIHQIESEVAAYVPKVTNKMIQKIKFAYRITSFYTLLLRLLMPRRDFFFQYRHPIYLDNPESHNKTY